MQRYTKICLFPSQCSIDVLELPSSDSYEQRSDDIFDYLSSMTYSTQALKSADIPYSIIFFPRNVPVIFWGIRPVMLMGNVTAILLRTS